MSSAAIDAVGALLQPGISLREVESGIWSSLPTDPGPQSYDPFAAGYDRLVGNRLYQRVVWGNEITRDTQLARDAAASSNGWLLDAGCGSLLFTDSVHAHSGRPTVGADLSLGMLRRGRNRLVARCGSMPDHVVLVQCDVFALPFQARSFQTVLCPGILHLFEQRAKLLGALAQLLADGGGFYVSALVRDRSFGARLLRFMENRGEIHAPMSSGELAAEVEAVFGRAPEMDVQGNMAHARLNSA